jgi:hypothetical protein
MAQATKTKARKANKRKHPKLRTKGIYWYDGPSADECKGPRLIYKGRLPNFRLPWPQDIADFYSGLGGMEV